MVYSNPLHSIVVNDSIYYDAVQNIVINGMVSTLLYIRSGLYLIIYSIRHAGIGMKQMIYSNREKKIGSYHMIWSYFPLATASYHMIWSNPEKEIGIYHMVWKKKVNFKITNQAILSRNNE